MLMVAATCYLLVNYVSYNDDSCTIEKPQECNGVKGYTKVISAYLIITICKNILMSTILFISLWKFYQGLVKIGLKFTIEKCVLAMHIIAFSLPIFSGFFYIVCMIKFN